MIEQHFKIEDFKSNKVTITWDEVVFGYKYHLFKDKDVIAFIEDWLSSDSAKNDPDATSLASTVGEQTLSDDIKEDIISKGNIESIKAKKKWIWLILDRILKSKVSDQEKLETIAEIWAEIDYPEEMRELIYYQPSEGQDFIETESRGGLIEKCEIFNNLLKKQLD